MERKGVFLERKVFYYLKRRVLNMRMAICDDDVKLIEELKTKIYPYANENRFELVIDEFYSGEAMLNSSYRYDIIILDYQMEGIDGLETARILRNKNVNCSIIFLTNYPHFIYEAFEVNTFRFFKKPIEHDKLRGALDDYFKMFGNDYPILLQHERETITLHTQDVVYLEAMNKHCLIHLFNRNMHCAKTMAVISKMLPRNHFCKVNRAFIINFNYVDKYSNDMIVFKNGESVHISRNYITAFKTAYRDYSNLKNPKRIESKR